MSEPVTLSQRQRKCLIALGQSYFPAEERCLYFRTVAAHTGLWEAEARRAVRALARKGLAEYHRGLFNDDGETAGSGYCLSPAGFELYKTLAPAAEAVAA